MKSKISVKTILLFTALFILGTMILGFYSCSGNTTPVSPQLTDDFTEDILVPPDGVTTIVNEDGTITIIDQDGDTTTTTPGTTITTEDGTTTTTYIVTIDESGDVIISSTPRVSEGFTGEGGDIDIGQDLVTMVFSQFVQDGELWTGNVIVSNHSANVLFYPRISFGGYAGPDLDTQSSGFSQVNFLDTLVNPDIYFGLYRGSESPATAFPTTFVADEDESYMIGPGEIVEHEITIRFPLGVTQCYDVNLAYQMTPINIVSEGLDAGTWIDIPRGIDIEFVYYFNEVSVIAITVDVGQSWAPEENLVFVEESLYGGLSTFIFSGYNGLNQPVYIGGIQWNPEEDGPNNVMAYFPLNPEAGVTVDSFMDFTTLTVE